MKKYLVLVICGFLQVGSVSAKFMDFTKQIAIRARAVELKREAEARAMEECSTNRTVYSYPTVVHDYFSKHEDGITEKEMTAEGVISFVWTGGCVAGKRDGDGVLTWTEEEVTNTRIDQTSNLEIRNVYTTRSEGRFVNGQRLGLWCMTYRNQTIAKGGGSDIAPAERSDSGCSVFAGHTNNLTGNYRKQPDGSWHKYDELGSTGLSLAAGALEAQSAKVLANAAAGKTDLKIPELIVQNRALDDLVRGSKIVLALSAAPISLKDKRVAIVLSSQTVSELERFKRERQALIDASAGLRGEAATERAKFIQYSNPDRLLVNILKVVQKHVKSAQPADDLVELQKGGFDYALVVDWKSMTRFDQLGKYDSFPIYRELKSPPVVAWKAGTVTALAGESLGGFLINRDLKAVQHFSPFPTVNLRWPLESKSDDQVYMSRLAAFFEKQWGKSPDDRGDVIFGLDYYLKK